MIINSSEQQVPTMLMTASKVISWLDEFYVTIFE